MNGCFSCAKNVPFINSKAEIASPLGESSQVEIRERNM